MTRFTYRKRAASVRRTTVIAAASIAALAPASASAAFTPSNIGDFQLQLYGAAPNGFNLLEAQDSTSPNYIAGANGENVKTFALEGMADFRHQSLFSNGAHAKLITPDSGDIVDTSEHALSTMSALAGRGPGSQGYRGILRDGDVSLYAADVAAEGIAGGIPAAADRMGPGDVMLLEAQGYNALPVEENEDTYDAIRAASDRGIIVIEPAGNAENNLDSPSIFPSRTDSGAIVVGGGLQAAHDDCGSSTDVARSAAGSSYGARVNVQGPYGCNAAAANNNGFDLGGDLTAYGFGFGGTSGASAMVAGVTSALSSAYEAARSEPLTPEGARNALVTTGSAQQPRYGESTITQPVGPLPNLAAAVAFLKQSPSTTITATPSGSTSTLTPTFSFSGAAASSPGSYTTVSEFDCRITRYGHPKPLFQSCSTGGSTGSWTPSTLRSGRYTFEVRAVSKSGTKRNFDPTPTTSTFTIKTGAGTGSVSSGTLTVNAASTTVDDNDDIFITESGSNILVRNYQTVLAGTGCSQLSDQVLTCPKATITKLVVNGYGGNDRIETDLNIETRLDGGAGDDILSGLGDAKDVIVGGTGVDTVSYEAAVTKRRVDFDGVADDGPFGGAAGAADQVGTDVESAIGGTADDELDATGTSPQGTDPRDSSPVALGRLVGGPGNDTIKTDEGIGRVEGNDGDDIVTGKLYNTYVVGGNDADTLSASSGGGQLLGGAGNDVLTAGAGGHTLRGGGGNDTLYGGSQDTQFLPGGGNDTIHAGTGVDTLNYTGRPDNLTINLTATGGTTITGGTITGAWAAGGTDTLVGSFETYTGGTGHDTIQSPAGSSLIDAGPGVDRVTFTSRPSLVVVGPLSALNGQPRLKATTTPPGGSLQTVELRGTEEIDGTPYNDTLIGGYNSTGDIHRRHSTVGVRLDGKGGNDLVAGGGYDDYLIGGPGIDSLDGRNGSDILNAADGVAGDDLTCTSMDTPAFDTGDIVNGVVNGTC